MSLKKYNNLLTSGSWYNKDLTDDRIIALVGVAQKLADDSKKSYDKSNKSNRGSTKGYPAYIREPPPWMLEEKQSRVLNETKDGK